MDRIEAWGVVDKLVNWILGGIILSKGEVLVRDCIVMVHVGHVSGNHSNSMLVEKFMTDASLSFNEKNFTEGTSE